MLLSIPFKDKTIQAKIDHQQKDFKNKIWIALTHGAGGDMNTPQLVALSKLLSEEGFVCLRFTCKGLNIKYRINVFAEVLKFIDDSYNPKAIIVGGRSMGARAAVMLSDKELPQPVHEKIKGILCLSYPLHKAKQLTELRDEPLKTSTKPIFFLSGTADEMCKKELLEKVLLVLKCPYRVHWLDGYDHSAKPKDNFFETAYVNAFKDLSKWCKNI